MPDARRYLLLQARDSDDPIRHQEVDCFASALSCDPENIRPLNLTEGVAINPILEEVDMVLIGGSGRYGATGNEAWLDRALDGLRQIHATSKPTFASCWGFQAMSRAMGGTVIKDMDTAELGTMPVTLTEDGIQDPILGPLGPSFVVPMGHEDRVVTLPRDAVLLASTERTKNQAFRFQDKPIYCTQFHSELDTPTLLTRVAAYPEYVERIRGVSMEEFAATCQETKEAAMLISRFQKHILGD